VYFLTYVQEHNLNEVGNYACIYLPRLQGHMYTRLHSNEQPEENVKKLQSWSFWDTVQDNQYKQRNVQL